MALGSLRELSIIASPPAKRTAIQTFVDEWDNNTITEACSRELHRGGQIFVVHNDIVGMGAAIVDTEVVVNDSFIKENDIGTTRLKLL